MCHFWRFRQFSDNNLSAKSETVWNNYKVDYHFVRHFQAVFDC